MTKRLLRCGDNGATGRVVSCAWVLALWLASTGAGMAAAADPGRLFFTPAQRAQLEALRARNVAQPAPGQPGAPDRAPAPLRYDGVVIRSDGKTTRWVDGKAQRDGSAVSGLKPGQIRANGKVYEPYQVLRPQAPQPTGPDMQESTP